MPARAWLRTAVSTASRRMNQGSGHLHPAVTQAGHLRRPERDGRLQHIIGTRGPGESTLSQHVAPFDNTTTGKMKTRPGQEHVVRKSPFADEQIALALEHAALGISDVTCYVWRKRFGDVGPSGLRRRQLDEENRKVKQLVADPSLNKAMLQAAVATARSGARADAAIRLQPARRTAHRGPRVVQPSLRVTPARRDGTEDAHRGDHRHAGARRLPPSARDVSSRRPPGHRRAGVPTGATGPTAGRCV